MSEGRQYPTKQHWTRDPQGVHWATVYIARDHRAADIEKCGEWLCPCRSCTDVRRALHSLNVAQANGGVR